MAINKDQVRELLGSGLGPEVVASAVGCDISYISQLLSQEEFASEVAVLRTKNLTSHNRRDATINGIEDRLLVKLSDMVDNDAFYKPRDVLAAAAVVNRMERRGHTPGVSGAVINNIIQLQLPAAVVRKFVTNRVNEVIEVEGQTLVTMPAHQLLKSLATMEKDEKGDENGGQYRDALKYLPSGLTTTTRDISEGNGEI